MKENQKGQSLIEVLVGMVTMSIIVGAITVVTINALNNAVYSKNQHLATEYAQQGMEIVRNLRDRQYSSFISLNGYYCLAKSCTDIHPTAVLSNGNPYDPCGPKSLLCQQNVGGENADIFVRQVFVDPNGTYCQDGTQNNTQGTQVTVNVSWYDQKCGSANIFCHTVQLSSCLSTYNAINP